MNNKHLYWSFQSSQTVKPTEEELKVFQEKYKKDFEQRELYEGEELEDKFRLNSWRNPIFNEIFSVILAFEHQDTLRIQYITGTEKDLLQNFMNLVKTKFQDYNLVHFDAEIILPYLGVRLNSNGHLTPPHNDLKYHNLKPWNFTGLDIKQYYKPLDWLKELSNTKQMTLTIKEGLKEQFFSKKRLTNKDKEIAFDLIRASLSDIDSNFGKTKNEADVDKIINDLKLEFEK